MVRMKSRQPQHVIAGLVPAISFRMPKPCHMKRDGRDTPGHDSGEVRRRIR
jgi:hypothetical protein